MSDLPEVPSEGDAAPVVEQEVVEKVAEPLPAEAAPVVAELPAEAAPVVAELPAEPAPVVAEPAVAEPLAEPAAELPAEPAPVVAELPAEPAPVVAELPADAEPAVAEPPAEPAPVVAELPVDAEPAVAERLAEPAAEPAVVELPPEPAPVVAEPPAEPAPVVAGPVAAELVVAELPAEPVAVEPAPVVAEPPAEPAPVVAGPVAAEPAVAELPAAPAPTETAPESPKIGASAPGDTEVPAPHRPDSDAGKVLGGIITSVTSDAIELNLDDGRPAVISRRNFDDDDTDPTSVYNVGDRAEGAVLTREDPKKRVVLSRAWALKKRAWERIAAAVETGELLTGPVTATSKRGVVVDVGVRGFVPSSHLELTPVKKLSGYVGQTFDFKVLEVDVAKERLVLSRRSILLKNQRKEAHDILASLEVGSTRTGTVSSLTDYGAFVDLGGINGLVHLSELSWQRVHRPSEIVKVGDEVDVKILDVKVKKRRVSLSMRQLTTDPFAAVEVGSVVEGPVCRLVDFGAFVELGGVEGLVHLSELAEFRVSSPEEIVFPGEVVRAKVLSVDKKRRRIELSIRQAVSGEFD